MSTTETQFDVEGMTCAACATRIERVLTKQEGVDQVVVNFASGNAKVFGEVHIPDLEAAVAKIGYGIQQLGEGDEKPDETMRVATVEMASMRKATKAMGAELEQCADAAVVDSLVVTV